MSLDSEWARGFHPGHHHCQQGVGPRMVPSVLANIPLTGLGKNVSAHTVVQEFWCFCRPLSMFCGKLSRRLGYILQKRKLVPGNGVQEKGSVWF